MIEILIALFLFFRQAAHYLGGSDSASLLLGGNVDPFFLVGLLGLLFTIKFGNVRFIRFYSIVLAVGLLQLAFVPGLEYLNWAINLLKLMLCMAALYFVRDNFTKIRLSWVVVTFSALVAAGTALALVMGPNELLWTLNDGVNKFDLTRLKLTFLEPSELGFTLVVVLIALIHLLFSTKSTRARWLYIVCIGINLTALYYAKPLGAIAIGAIAVIAMAAFQLLAVRPTVRKQVGAISLALAGALLVAFLLSPSSPLQNSNDTLVQRGLYATEGEDSSINYRVGLSFEIAIDALLRAPITGHGFGNVGTDNFIQQYSDKGLVTPLVNSYLAFIAEAGLVGVLIVMYLIIVSYRAAFRSRSAFVFGLVTFIVVYQFTGSHFANPLIWSLYGVALAIEDSAKLKNRKRKDIVQVYDRKKALNAK